MVRKNAKATEAKDMRVFAEGVPKAGHEERVRQPIARFFTSLVGDVEVECEASATE